MGMVEELREAPEAVGRQSAALTAPIRALVTRLQSRPPQLVVTCARGSSAHAATFAKHLIELHLGIPVAAMAPNIATVYRRPLRLGGQLFLAISQSGRSDDLVEAAFGDSEALQHPRAQRCMAGGASDARQEPLVEDPVVLARHAGKEEEGAPVDAQRE